MEIINAFIDDENRRLRESFPVEKFYKMSREKENQMKSSIIIARENGREREMSRFSSNKIDQQIDDSIRSLMITIIMDYSRLIKQSESVDDGTFNLILNR